MRVFHENWYMLVLLQALRYLVSGEGIGSLLQVLYFLISWSILLFLILDIYINLSCQVDCSSLHTMTICLVVHRFYDIEIVVIEENFYWMFSSFSKNRTLFFYFHWHFQLSHHAVLKYDVSGCHKVLCIDLQHIKSTHIYTR
jgi:hypothetical protein